MLTKAPPRAYEARWNVWAAGFGGSRTADGSTALGSSHHWQYSRCRRRRGLLGLAGHANFSVPNGGSGQSNLF
jgi:hypothetical protein